MVVVILDVHQLVLMMLAGIDNSDLLRVHFVDGCLLAQLHPVSDGETLQAVHVLGSLKEEVFSNEVATLILWITLIA